MNTDDPRSAVQRFVRRAREMAGTGSRLAEAIAAHLPPDRQVEGETVNGWAQGARMPGGDQLFAMIRALSGLSLDEFALGEQERSNLQAQLDRLTYILGWYQAELDLRLVDLGQEPIGLPPAQET